MQKKDNRLSSFVKECPREHVTADSLTVHQTCSILYVYLPYYPYSAFSMTHLPLSRLIAGLLTLVILGGILTLLIPQADAAHTWGNYHWARTTNPLKLKLADNVSAAWDSYLATTSAMWSSSSVIDTTVVLGTKAPRTCKPTKSQAEICNATYGKTGWLGIASVWASGNHITQGTVKMNDTYYNTSTYNTPAWRTLVMCQEVGHLFGLGHQDENFSNANLGTCMDYTNSPASNQQPNQHDYDLLEQIYAHLDTTNTASQSLPSSQASSVDTNNPREWGREVARSGDGRSSLYVREFGEKEKLFTHIFWAPEGEADNHDHNHDEAHETITDPRAR